VSPTTSPPVTVPRTTPATVLHKPPRKGP
jgi:hypothetical protein